MHPLLADFKENIIEILTSDGDSDLFSNAETDQEGLDHLALEPELDPVAAQMRTLERLLEDNPLAALYHVQQASINFGPHIDQNRLSEIYMQAYDQVVTYRGGLSAAFHHPNEGPSASFGAHAPVFDLGLPSFMPRPEELKPEDNLPSPAPEHDLTAQPAVQPVVQPVVHFAAPRPGGGGFGF